MPTYEGLRLKVLGIVRENFATFRRKMLKDTSFTIISNNCWGGMIYESYDLPKQSPTVGAFFMADDYIKFLADLSRYLQDELRFIQPEQSKWKHMPQVAQDSRFGSYPIGILSNGEDVVEVFFLHAHNEQEARDKWKRRCQRINWDRLLVKFNDQNGCTEKHIAAFEQLPFLHKVCFTVKEYPQYPSVVKISAPKTHKFIRASYEPFGNNKRFPVTRILNEIIAEDLGR